MIGSVSDDGLEATLTVSVMGLSDDREERIETVVVDTGFTGHLTLRPETVERLALSVAGSAESILADGSVAIEEFCLARVVWHGIEHPIQALIADATPLLGMSLLRGSELRVEAKGGGEMSIRPLP